MNSTKLMWLDGFGHRYDVLRRGVTNARLTATLGARDYGRRMFIRAIALAFVIACTSTPKSSTGDGVVDISGTLGGAAPLLMASASKIETDTKGSMLIIALSPFDDPCAAPSLTTASSSAIELVLYKADSASDEVVAATDLTTYNTEAIGTPGPYLEIDVFDRDATCSPTHAEGKGTGTVTLTAADSAGYSGTFDFTTGNDHLQGSFSSESCAFSDAQTCQ